MTKKSLNRPEKTRASEKLRDEMVTVNGIELHKITVGPGWQWSKHLKPIMGGDSCQVDHLLYVISGSLHVKMQGGDELIMSEGDVMHIPAGHDGWNTGTEPVVWLEIPH